jgi:iron complex transport system ATP-binding protein
VNALNVTGLTGGYRGRPVISGLSFGPLAPGSVLALVGPNGARKSTLIRAVAGLIPARGNVLLGDTDLLALPPARRGRHVAFMPQTLPPGSSLTVLEEVLCAVDDRARAVAALDRLGIADLALAPLGQLSGGQRQLAGLAQAVARDPALLLLDEPTSALDLRHQFRVMVAIRALAAGDRIVVVVLHDLALAARWADSILVLDRGRLRAEGRPADVLTSPLLAEVYGVTARIDHSLPAIAVDGIVPEKPYLWHQSISPIRATMAGCCTAGK